MDYQDQDHLLKHFGTRIPEQCIQFYFSHDAFPFRIPNLYFSVKNLLPIQSLLTTYSAVDSRAKLSFPYTRHTLSPLDYENAANREGRNFIGV